MSDADHGGYVPRAANGRSIYVLSGLFSIAIGYFSIVPLHFIGLAVDNILLVDLGWSDGNTVFDEDPGLILGVAIVFQVPLLGLFFLLNAVTLRLFKQRSRVRFWLINLILLVAPALIVWRWPSVWDVIGWSLARR